MIQKNKIQKRLFLLFAAIATGIVSLFAQDVITLKDGNEIIALVYEIGDIDVKYKRTENPNGPNYVLKKSEILKIIYANGSKDEFNDATPVSALEINRLPVLVETLPEFPDGELALQEWLKKNLKYPKDAEKNEIQGRVIVSFTVDKDGKIHFAQVTQKIHPALDKEALRLVKSMSKWKPATKRGKVIRAQHSLSISFRLD